MRPTTSRTGQMTDVSPPDGTHARHKAVLALGGNLGDVEGNLVAALEGLAAQQGIHVRAASSVWRTRPWGLADQPDFLNMALLVETGLAPRALLQVCLDIERMAGRVRETRWGPRALDIDIIAFDSERVDQPDLTIPHPRARERMFVLVPMCEIAADMLVGEETAAAALVLLDKSLPAGAPDRDMHKDTVATGRVDAWMRSRKH